MAPKFPGIKVKLVGEDGNAFAIMGKVKKALKRGGVSDDQCAEFIKQTTSGDYDNLLRVCMEWVDVE